ncbi:hypothetical protein BJ165DRAFT_169655 [Panaeolus papilionaceus]|nr:hypothetical protein BJ165DRAFT_169655 [Panaeolus papilionaceus]
MSSGCGRDVWKRCLMIGRRSIAAYLPIIRFPLLVAAVCSLVSLICSCSSMMCFAALKSSEAVVEFIAEVSKEGSVLWNVWILLSLPIIWFSWALVSMVIALGGFVWLTGTASDNPNPIGTAARGALLPRIVISVLFALGVASLCSSVFTGRYLRQVMQKKKKRTIENLIKDYLGISPDAHVDLPPRYECAIEQYIGKPASHRKRDLSEVQSPPPYMMPSRQPYIFPPPPPPPPPKVSVIKLLSLFAEKRLEKEVLAPSDEEIELSHLSRLSWDELQKDIKRVWNTEALNPLFKILKRWNETHFNRFGGQIVLAQETEPKDAAEYGIYYVSTLDRELPHNPSEFDRLPPHELAIFMPPTDFT